MKHNLTKNILSAMAWVGLALTGQAQNPLIHHHFSADPAPYVYNDRLYIYYDRDEGGSFYTMNEWRVISSNDLVNWTDHGDVLPITAFSWANVESHSAWASQCIERNGKFYWYICVQYKGDWRHTIGVAVSDSPSGPFKDALGKPLIPVTEGGQIDPTVFIDDDGQAYLYYGNNLLRYVKLNEDMISYDKTIGSNGVVSVPLTKEAFGGVKNDDGKVVGEDAYEEGPWLHKYNGKYYLSYAAGGVPEHMSYSTSDKPTGPWKYGGVVMPTKNTGSFTNHGGIFEFRGKHYVAYHSAWLPGGGGFTRSACLDELHYNADGSIQPVTETKSGVKPVATLNPFELQEAETMNTSTGLWVYTKKSPRTIYVGNIDKTDTLRVRNVDFAEGASAVTAYVSSTKTSGYIEVYADKILTSKLLAKIPVAFTDSDEDWQPVTVPVKEVTGIHDILFRFNCSATKDNKSTFTFDKWQFSPISTERKVVGINAQVDKYTIDKEEEYGNVIYMTVKAVYSDGTEEDVTEKASVNFGTEGILTHDGNTLRGMDYGKTSIAISYEGISTTRVATVRSYFNENAVESIRIDGDNISDGVCTLLNGSIKTVIPKAVYFDKHEADVSSAATYSNEDISIVSNSKGKLTTKMEGDSKLTVSFQGKLGEKQSTELQLQVRNFPFKTGLINPSISGTGTFTEKTCKIKTTKGGLAGWQYEKNINFSAYTYLIIRLSSASLYKPSFRLYESTDVAAAYASADMNRDTEIVINLKELVKNDGTPLDLTKIRMAGFSTTGGTVAVKEMILTNDITGIQLIDSKNDKDADTSTYDLNGRKTNGTQKGIYIKGGKKVVR